MDDDEIQTDVCIFVKLATGKTITLDGKPSTSIYQVQKWVRPMKESILLGKICGFFGKNLEGNNNLSKYNIHKDSTLCQGIEILSKTGKTL
jgi:hypothetical protein